MSFVNQIPAAELPNYKTVSDWPLFFSTIKRQPAASINGAVVKISKNIFTTEVIIEGDLPFGFDFEDCYFQKSLLFHDSVSIAEQKLNRCFIDEDFKVTTHRNVFQAELNLINLSVKHKVIVSGGTYKECKWSFKNETDVYINGGEFKELIIGYWGGSSISNLTLELNRVSGFVRITDEKTCIQNLSVLRPASECNLTLEDIKVNNLSFYRYRNEKGLRISNIKALLGKQTTEFSLCESYMGKAEFYSIDFNAFQNVFFTDVHLVDCSFINVKWNYNIKSFKGRRIHQTDYEKSLVEKIKRIENNAEDDFVEIEELKIDQTVIEYYVKLREVFRQLKYSLSKQGDIIHEQKFHTKEMLAYNRSLRYPDNGWTKAIIKMSYWFSDFGQSFNRPFWALLIGHWLLFVILLSLNNYHDLQISLYKPTWEGFELAFERYWQLINPFRKADFNFDGYKIIIDILMRIWSSYMIYNMIRATRRFIK